MRGASEMPDHREPPPTKLAHGPAKPEDIERVRRDVKRAEERVTNELCPDEGTAQADETGGAAGRRTEATTARGARAARGAGRPLPRT
jgi:hypothetical protein